MRKLTKQKFLVLITPLLKETGTLEVAECLFVLQIEEVYEMIAVEVKGRDQKITWEIAGTYTVPNEDMRVTEKLANRTRHVGSTTKRSIIEGDLNYSYAEWNGHAEKSRGTRVFLN